MARRTSPLPISAALLLAVSTNASAALDPTLEIDLAVEGFISYPQTNARWAQYPVGANRTSAADEDVTIGNCGCLLATLGSIAQFYYGGTSVPYFPYLELYTGQQVMSFSPRYLDLFLMVGKGEGPQPADGWGYKSLPPGTCGTAPKRWALESSARSSEVVDPLTGKVLLRTPSGLRWGAYEPVGPSAWDAIDANLLAGKPTIVVVEIPQPSGATTLHAQLVVGWDGPNNGYKIMDPAWPTFLDALRPGAGDVDSYTAWLTSVVKVFDVHTVTAPLDGAIRDSIAFYDDPGPIELLVVAPDGRRTGFDPGLGRHVRELESADAYSVGAWTSPAGTLAASEPARFLEVAEPVDGTWRFQATGTGDGEVPLTLSILRAGAETVLLDVVAPVTPGAAVKFEVRYLRSGQRTAAQVVDFTPQGRIVAPARARTDEPVPFDGSASFDVDGAVSAHRWDFADGTTAEGAVVSHTWTAPGIYPVRLTVTDAGGVTGSAVQQVNVSGNGPNPSGWLTERVSTSSSGGQVSGDSVVARISADGRYVAFESTATDLVPLDLNGVIDVFVKDLATGAVERVSITSAGEEAAPDLNRGGSRSPSLSADGRFVAFTSRADNLVEGDTNGWPDTFVHDRQTGVTERVSVSSTGEEADGRSGGAVPTLSADGRFVAFVAAASNLVPGGFSLEQVYVRDRVAGTTELVSVARDGTPGGGNGDSGEPSISADGRFVSFSSEARNLVAQDIGLWSQSFVRDRQAGTTEVVSLTDTGSILPHHGMRPAMSADGRYVAFESSFPATAEDGNGRADVFVRDRQAATTTRVSVSTFGGEGDAASVYPAISPDGRWVAFHSTSSNLVPDDTNRTGALPAGVDVFLHDRETGVTDRASVSTEGVEAVPDAGLLAFASVGAGGAVVFYSGAANLVPGDTNASNDVFVHRRPAVLPVADASGPYAGWASGPGAPAHVTFDARRSFDPSGAPLTARWDFGDGSPIATAGAASPIDHAYAAAGEFTVTLVVTNGTLDSEPVTTTASVRAALPGAAATARTTAIPACGAPGAIVRLHARGAPLASAAGGWDFGAGLPPPATATARPETSVPVTFAAGAGVRELPGVVDFVEVEGGVEVTTRVRVALPGDLTPGDYAASVAGATPIAFAVPCPSEPNPRPHARAGGPYQAVAGVAVALDGSGSSAPGGAALEYTWDFGDDETGTGARPQHVYAAPGTYLVTLVVNDGTRSSIPIVRGASYAQVLVEPLATDEAPALPASRPASGCGCGQGGAGGLASFLAGIALLAPWRRRRRA
jgi:PKD repeat protein